MLDAKARRRARARAVGALRPGGRPGRTRRGHHGRHAAARRDPARAVPRRAGPRPRRADRRAHRAGGARPVRRCSRRSRPTARASSSSRTSSTRCSTVVRPRDRAAARQADRHRRDEGRHRGVAGAAHGRARGAARDRQAGGHAQGAGPRAARPRGQRRPRAAGGARGVPDRPRRRDRRAGRRRRQRPERAGGGDHGPAPDRWRDDPRRRQGPDGRGSARPWSTTGVCHIPEDRHRRGLVLEFTLAENLALRDYDTPEMSRFGLLSPQRMRERAQRLLDEYDVRGGDPVHARARRCRAATSRRSCARARSATTRAC